MTTRLTISAIALVLTMVASASAQYAPSTRCAQPDEKNLASHNCYTNRDGQPTHAPSRTYDGAPPSGATARCADGTYSYSQNRSGTCSHHGGIAR
jgi:uncharacterized protein DUF3761